VVVGAAEACEEVVPACVHGDGLEFAGAAEGHDEDDFRSVCRFEPCGEGVCDGLCGQVLGFDEDEVFGVVDLVDEGVLDLSDFGSPGGVWLGE